MLNQGLICPLRKSEMESSMKTLSSDFAQSLKAYNCFLERCSERQKMREFFNEHLPDVVASIGNNENSSLRVLGLGSGSGEIDFEILGKIQSKHPGVSIHNEVVEPNPLANSKYKELVKEKGQGLNISFTWNQMCSEEYEKQNNERMANKKFDFIHMVQMLYFVESMYNTIKYFHSLLEKNGKLLIIYASANNGVHTFWDKYGPYFNANFFFDVCKVLDEMRMKYRNNKFSAELDISECFIEGNKNGELLLDFITGTMHFGTTAPANIKAEVLQFLRQPQCSRVENGKILYNNDMYIIVVDC
ncbi:histamine N-methyltransferase-like isoform X2 [Mustelus asterias]